MSREPSEFEQHPSPFLWGPARAIYSSSTGVANVCCTLALPMGILEFEMSAALDVETMPRGQLARP